jgi:large repetitive protein
MTNFWSLHRGASRQYARRSGSRCCRPGVELFEQRTLLSAVVWTGGAGTDDWDTPANWSTNTLPGSGDDVTIGSGSTVVHADNDSDSINSLTSSGTLEISSGSLAIASASTAAALTIGIGGGTLTVNGTLTVSGLLSLMSGTLSGSGAVDANGGVTIDGATLNGTTIDNAAGQTATWTGGRVLLENGAAFSNAGTFSIPAPAAGSSIFDGYWYENTIGIASSFNNTGAVVASSGARANECFFSVPFNSSAGTVEVTSGFFGLGGGGTSTGTVFTASSGAQLALGGAAGQNWTLDSTSAIGGAGTITFSEGGTFTINGSYDVTGATNAGDDFGYNLFGGGAGTINFDGPVDSVGSTLTLIGNNLNFNTPLSSSAATIPDVDIEESAGTLNFGSNDVTIGTLTDLSNLAGTGNITVSGPFTSNDADGSAGTISGGCTLDADGGMVLASHADALIINGSTLKNPAGETISIPAESEFVFQNRAIFNNLGTIDVTNPTPFGVETSGYTQPTGAFNNEGTFIVNAPLGATMSDPQGNPVYFGEVAFNNPGGSVQVQQGTLLLDGGGRSTGGSFNVASGATLQVDDDNDAPYTFDSATTFSGAGAFAEGDDFLAAEGLSGDVNGSLVTFAGTSTLAGGTTLTAGTLQVDGSLSSSAVTVAPQVYAQGVTLSGSGTVGSITTASSATVGTPPYQVTTTSSNISPGDGVSHPGVLTADGNVELSSATNFNIALNGATAGTGYDQLNATGSINLGGSTFSGTLGFTPAAGETFTILRSTAPVTGTFAGLPEGASLTIGGEQFTITYAADGGDAVVLTTKIAQTLATTTTTSLSSSANPSTVGQTVAFTAAVSSASGSGTPTGTVTFTIDGQPQTPSSLAVVGGVDEATFSTTALTAGSHDVSAVYSGNATFAGSTATSLTQVVGAVPVQTATMTTLSSSADPSTVGQAIVFTAIVAPSSGSGTPTGTVTFSIDGQAETPSSLSVVDGIDEAAFRTTALSAGAHTISAAYSGDTTFAASTGTGARQTVDTTALEDSVTQLHASADPATVGQTVVFTAIIAPTNGSATPTGTVTFTIDGKAGLPVTLSELDGRDQATLTMPAGAAGSYTITASYSGDSSFAASSSSTTEIIAPYITPATTDGPTVVSLLRFGYHMRPTSVVLTFDQALDELTAQDDENYRIIGPAGRVIDIKLAVYDPATLSVTLHPEQRINIHHTYELIVDGTAPHGVTNTFGQLLDGTGSGHPDSDYRTSLTWRDLVLDPVPKGMARWAKKATASVKPE